MTRYLRQHAFTILLFVLPGLVLTTHASAQSAGYAVTASQTTVAPGSTVTVSWQAASNHSAKDWVGLFAASSPSAGNTIISWKYVSSGTSGTMTFTAPNTLVKQTYQLRYLLNDGFTEAARSNTITVTTSTGSSTSPSSSTPTSYTVSANPLTVASGGSIAFTWTAPSTRSAKDWVGLFSSSMPSAGNTIISWKYVPSGTSGSMTFTAPKTLVPQTYQVRYLLNDGFTEGARSSTITVSTSTSTAPPPTTSTPTPTSGTSTPATSPTTTSCPNGQPLAFEGAEGFGRCTQGGRGGPIVDVTNLNNSGPGSLRQCAEVMSGPRVCRIVVAGTVSLGGYDITIRNPNVTIDGQAAPMALKDGGIVVRASQTIIRHLRVRPGAKSWLDRGMNANGITYMSTETGAGTDSHIADHVSISWCTDDSIAVINGTKDVTVQDSILSEGLMEGPTCPGCYGKGLLVGTGNRETLSVLRTLNAHNFIRFPNASGGKIDFVNNVDYNGNGSNAQIVPYYNPVLVNMVGNYWKDGPSSAAFKNGFNLGYNVIRTLGGMTYSPQSGIYVLDNIGRSRQTGTAPETNILWQDNGGVPVQSVRYPYPQMTTTSALQAYETVLNESGAQPRDAADARVVNDVRNGTGVWISSPLAVGGWPLLTADMP